MLKHRQSKVLLFSLLLFLTSCGGGKSSNNTSNEENPNDDSSVTSGLNGIITLDEWDNLLDRRSGVVSFTLNDGVAKKGRKMASGSYPYRHMNGQISFSSGCGDSVSRILIRMMSGITKPVTPCGSELVDVGNGSPHYFEHSKISPNGKFIAAEVRHFNQNIDWIYTTLVYELNNSNKVGKEIARHTGYAAPEWLPDGRLMIVPFGAPSFGLYVTDNTLQTLNRIDNNQIQVSINNPDVSPSGESVIFEYNQQIWKMNMNGSMIEELIVAGSYLKFPTWSPNGKYIAFLQKGALDDYHAEITIYDTQSKEVSHILTKEFFAPNSYGTYQDPNGPLSWINPL